MGKMTAITAEIDEETLAALDEFASGNGQSREAALAEWARYQRLIDDPEAATHWAHAAQEGIGAIARGEIASHDDVVKKIDEMIARHQAR